MKKLVDFDTFDNSQQCHSTRFKICGKDGKLHYLTTANCREFGKKIKGMDGKKIFGLEEYTPLQHPPLVIQCCRVFLAMLTNSFTTGMENSSPSSLRMNF